MNPPTTSALKNEPPLVIHVLTSLGFGGVERHMEVIAGVLDHSQMRHIFVAIGGGGATATHLNDLGVQVACLGQKIKFPSFGAFTALLRLFRREKPWVVHTHGAEANLHGLIAAAVAGVPVRIGEEIGMPSHGNKAKWVFRQIYRPSHRVIGISQSVANWLVVSGEVLPEKVVCLYNPVQLPEACLSELPDADRKFRVCFVGRLESVKNPLALVRVAHQLVSMGVPLEISIIGEGSQRQRIEQEICEYGLAAHVKLLGFQSDPSLFMRQCHLYAQPSLSEGFGIALVEAMGCGLPVIATRVGGAPEIVEHDVTGWLLDDAMDETLVAALHSAWTLGTKNLFERGQLARQSVEGRFEPANYLADLENLYRQTATDRGIGKHG
jgi:glycosyltransferase involved in cell wall biosynthesis